MVEDEPSGYHIHESINVETVGPLPDDPEKRTQALYRKELALVVTVKALEKAGLVGITFDNPPKFFWKI